MSASITVVGNLTKDPELKFSNSGKPFIRFSIAETFKSNNGEENTSYYDAVAFDSLATNIADTFVKGSRVFVQGRFQMKEFNRKDGTKGTAGEIIVDAAGPELRFAKAQVVRNERGNTNSYSSNPAPSYASAPSTSGGRSYEFDSEGFEDF
jgi:single-strand DNA-binding protein